MEYQQTEGISTWPPSSSIKTTKLWFNENNKKERKKKEKGRKQGKCTFLAFYRTCNTCVFSYGDLTCRERTSPPDGNKLSQTHNHLLHVPRPIWGGRITKQQFNTITERGLSTKAQRCDSQEASFFIFHISEAEKSNNTLFFADNFLPFNKGFIIT